MFLFPGQGSQAVGMLQASKDLPAVKTMLSKAQEVLGYDLLDVCLNGRRQQGLQGEVHRTPAVDWWT